MDIAINSDNQWHYWCKVGYKWSVKICGKAKYWQKSSCDEANQWFMYDDKVLIRRHPDSNAIRKLHVDLKFLKMEKYRIN